MDKKTGKDLELEMELAKFLFDDHDEWDEITKDETPVALEVARQSSKPPSRSGEYLRSLFADAIEASKRKKKIAGNR
jgi:hypothetical protein